MTTVAPPRFLTPAEVCELVPGMTLNNLAQLRYRRRGPRFYKPTPRIVTYREDDVLAWIEAGVQETNR